MTESESIAMACLHSGDANARWASKFFSMCVTRASCLICWRAEEVKHLIKPGRGTVRPATTAPAPKPPVMSALEGDLYSRAIEVAMEAIEPPSAAEVHTHTPAPKGLTLRELARLKAQGAI